MNHGEIVSFLWGVADLIRDSFKRGKYQDVILPLTVLRRLDCVLAPTKEKVLARRAELRELGLEDMDAQLRRSSGFAFYNTSRYDFEKLLADAPQLAANLRNYIVGFSRNMREVLERFDFDNTISKLDEAGLLFQVLERFRTVDLHPDKVDNPTMGTIFEELIRRFNEALDENPGEHFTPRDVVHLMVELMLAGDEREIARPGVVRTVYDPCCGSGGMLMIAKEHITEGPSRNGEQLRPAINPEADIHLFGQEVNPETWAVSKSDFFMKDPTGRDADHIAFGSTLSHDRHAAQSFDYLIANPPYGKDWKRDQAAVREEHERGVAGRFGPGLPRISDGQTLFLLHMLARAKAREEGGARMAIIMNGSPLFTGDSGSGESEIRRFILENDLLEALIALPEQLFYNTGIATYVWLLSNRKAPARRGRVQLIDATSFWSPMRRSLGDKRREIPPEKAADVLKLLVDFEDGATRMVAKDGKEEERVVSRVYPPTHFGYRRITVERPLRLNFQANPERIARLKEQRGFQNLAKSRKRGEAGAREEAEGRARQQAILTCLERIPDTRYLDRVSFVAELTSAAGEAGVRLPAAIRNAILAALSERDEKAEVCRSENGAPEPDPNLRDTERVPLPEGEDPIDNDGVPESVRAFFAREVLPHVPDAWIDTARRDHRDGQVGPVGYEINFNRYFYRYTPPRPLAEIEADIQSIEKDILELLQERRISLINAAVTNGLDPDVPMKNSGVEWLGEIPAHWDTCRMWKVCEAVSGGTPSREEPSFWDGAIPWVSPKDMKRRLLSDTEENISDAGLHESGLKLISPPAILVVVRGMILAHSFPVAISSVPLTINQDMKALMVDDGIEPRFFAWLLDGVSRHILSVATEKTGHGTRSIRMDQWRSIELPFPRLHEQRAIADYLDRETAKIDALVAKVREAVERLKELRSALISAAVTGKIDVRETAV